MSSFSNKTKAKVKMIEMGIVPAFTGREVKEMLESLSLEDRKVAKRKFRKAWRNIAKRDKTLQNLLLSDNSPDNSPDKATLRNRSCWVVSEIIKEVRKV